MKNFEKHWNHEWDIVYGEWGPHRAKVVCKTCDNKWLKWMSVDNRFPTKHIEDLLAQLKRTSDSPATAKDVAISYANSKKSRILHVIK